MDLLPLLRAHAERVAHLREVLYGDGVVNEVMAADDEACQLGQWPKQASELPHLSRLLVRALQELSQATA